MDAQTSKPKEPRPLPSEPWGDPLTHCPGNPPCSVLLDPRNSSLPDHVSAEVAQLSTWFFADSVTPLALSRAFDLSLMARAGRPVDAPELAVTDLRVAAFYFAWRLDWPLLVGPPTEEDLDHLLALAEEVLKGWGLAGPPLMAPLPGPFVTEPGARAGLVLERRSPEGRVVLFGLVKEAQTPSMRIFAPTPSQPWRFAWTTPPQGVLKEPVVVIDRPSAAPLAVRLERWYNEHLLGRVVRGRPPGITTYTEDEFKEAYLEAYRELRRSFRSPRQDQVAERLGISEATLRNYLRRWGLPWPPR